MAVEDSTNVKNAEYIELTGRFVQRYLAASSVTTAPDQNYVTSPIGLLLLLTTFLGSGAPRGKSARQIAFALDLVSKTRKTGGMLKALDFYQDLSQSLASEVTEIQGNSTNVIKTANAVFIQEKLTLTELFRYRLVRKYMATLQKVNFGTKNAVQLINSLVNEKSGGLIPQIFKDTSELPANTKLLLMNILTFKDNWDETFDLSKPGTFYLTPTKNLTLEMMKLEERLPHVDLSEKGFAMIRKPMRNHRFSFVVALPTKKWDMRGVNTVLSGNYSIKDLFDKHSTTELVSLELPKFQIGANIDVISPLRKMGITDLFDSSKADLSGMTPDEKFHVSQMNQGLVLKVDEYGVEAAAATYFGVSPLMNYKPVEFHVNHPFVCMIYDEKLDVPILAARIINPNS